MSLNNRFHDVPLLEQLLRRTHSIEDKLTALENTVAAAFERLGKKTNERTWWTTVAFAEVMDVSPFTVRTHWIAKGRVPGARKTDGGRWLIPDATVQALLRGEPLDPPTH